MKTKTMTALAVLMLAAASLPAAAQERGERGRDRGGERRTEFRQEGARERPHRGWNGGEGARQARPSMEARQAPQAPQAPQAREAPRAGEAQRELWRAERQRADGQRGDRRGGPDMRRPGRWTDNDGDDRTVVSPADQIDREDRDEARDARRWNGGNVQWDGRQLRDGSRDGRHDGDRRGDRDGQRDGERRWDRDGRRGGDRDGRWDGRWSREDRDRWDRDDRDRDRRRGDRPYWSQGRYPFSYHSQRRYRAGRWIAPPGFYVRSWSYGDHLPWGWYGSSYRLNDWYAYGLPWPPPGFDWVRVGPDVLLVDRFTGRVVQVVRMVFW